MITEQFINSCLSMCLNEKCLSKINKSILRDILVILDFYKKKEKDDIPIPIRNKLECLELICNFKIKDKTNDNIIDSISVGEKYKSLIDFLKIKIEEKIEDLIIDDNIQQIVIRKKVMSLFFNYDKINDFLEIVRNGSFKSLDSISEDYEKFVKQMYTSLMECNRNITLKSSASLDLVNDDYSSVLDLIKNKLQPSNLVKSGFEILDNDILNGGFEKGRLYIIAGGSGSGKSTLLINLVENGLISDSTSSNRSVYIYITLENLIDETLLRLYQSMFKITTKYFRNNVNELTPEDMKKSIMDKIGSNGSSIVMKYFPKFSISPIDVSMVIDDVMSTYGKENIKAVLVDYLDLLELDRALGRNFEAYRLELSRITSNLKDIAVAYNVPLITVSQLNREVYSSNPDAKGLNLGMMSEAIKKVEHADFIGLMSKDQTNDYTVYMNVAKNRDGPNNKCLEFKVDFSYFKFLNGYDVSGVNAKSSNVKADQLTFTDISSKETTKKNDWYY